MFWLSHIIILYVYSIVSFTNLEDLRLDEAGVYLIQIIPKA